MIVVLGLGRETRQLLRVLDREQPGARVLVLDEGQPGPELLPATCHLDVEVVAHADLDVPDLLPAATEVAYRSPGISPYRPALAAARARGVPMTTPTGWWAARRDGDDVLAITGTKGKSTTAALTAHLLAAAGRQVSLRGNIGRAALDADELEDDAEDLVLELSSYQLADLDARFALAGITTLLRDHVPWHGSVARYHRDKLRLLTLADRRVVTPQVAAHPAVDPGEVDAVVTTTLADHAAALATALRGAGLVGEHLVVDAALAIGLVDARLERAAGLRELIGSLAGFRPLPHRLTPVARRGGLTFVDDSISTVPESAVAAVAAYRPLGPVTVLLGGDDRGQDLAPLIALLADPEVRAVLLPPLSERLEAALAPVATGRVHAVADLPAAVDLATAITPAGGAVVLSPAAPSFSAYRDFVARGEHFVTLVTAGR